MTVSIIIVNYNVKFYLEQCLCSVKNAIGKMDVEVFVVDNHSQDGSLEFLKPKFPWVHFIENKENLGFSKANNIALKKAVSKYVLFLNPDTLISEESIQRSVDFMNLHPEAGALGVKMIDGNGNYLKESKRGFPSPWVAFCKLSGLTSIFPHSKIFSKYYLGYLDENKNQEIDAVSGAFMFVKKEVLDKTSGFDEQFFMYAEDIDLSYRIQKAGYKNYYLAEKTILHFKGESTKKDIKYVKQFYSAMSLFSKKHFKSRFGNFFLFFIEIGIKVRAGISAFANFFSKIKMGKKDGIISLSIKGDIQSKRELEEKLKSSNHNVIEDADAIVFCQGGGLSFTEIIKMTGAQKSNKQFFFYFSSSSSLIGANLYILV